MLRSTVCGLLVAASLAACGFVPEPEVGLACQAPTGRAEDPPAMAERQEFLGKTPQAAAELIEGEDPDADVTWRYHYLTDPTDENVGYSECWCIPPPDGRVMVAEVTEFGQLLIMVRRDQPIPGGRPQPRLGWGCDAEPDAAVNRALV